MLFQGEQKGDSIAPNPRVYDGLWSLVVTFPMKMAINWGFILQLQKGCCWSKLHLRTCSFASAKGCSQELFLVQTTSGLKRPGTSQSHNVVNPAEMSPAQFRNGFGDWVVDSTKGVYAVLLLSSIQRMNSRTKKTWLPTFVPYCRCTREKAKHR